MGAVIQAAGYVLIDDSYMFFESNLTQIISLLGQLQQAITVIEEKSLPEEERKKREYLRVLYT